MQRIGFEPSVDLQVLMRGLTKKQRAALIRLAHGTLAGLTMRELLKGPDPICAWTTYYAKPRGWHHQPQFRQALDLAVEEYEAAVMMAAVDSAAQRVRKAAPAAAELVVGLVQLVLTGETDADLAAVRRLMDMAGIDTEPEKKKGTVSAEGEGPKHADQIRAASVLVDKGLKAALEVLEQVQVDRALEGLERGAGTFRDWIEDLRQAGEDHGEVAELAAEAGDIQQGGLVAEQEAGEVPPKPGAAATIERGS